MSLDSLYASLNPAQSEAVFHESKQPLLVLAGAGSGKTRVIALSVIRLIAQEGFKASSILGFTFTNKAAQEMQGRVNLWLGERFSPTLKTFHSFGAWFLRRYAPLVGMGDNFSIWDQRDVMDALKNLKGLSGETYEEDASLERANWRAFSQAILSAKEAFETSEQFLKRKYDYLPNLPRLLELYESYKRRSNAFDFADLICEPIKILREHATVKKRMHETFKAIFVDEYQDTNHSQFLLLKELVGSSTRLCAVGDEDQCIYSFRGARLENILHFQDHFKDTKILRLEENYRSTANIIQASTLLIAKNEKRLGKTLFTRQEAGAQIKLYIHSDPKEEAVFWVNKLRKEKNLISSHAIIYRTNKQSRVFEEALREARLPYKVLGSLKFYEREEIKDALAYLKCIDNPQDQLAFLRIVNKPARGLGKKALSLLKEYLGKENFDVWLALKTVLPELNHVTQTKVQNFLQAINHFRDDLYDLLPKKKKTLNLCEAIARLFDELKLLDYYKKIDERELSEKLSNIEEFISSACDYGTSSEELRSFLEKTELAPNEWDEDGSKEQPLSITLSSIHAAKGLEFDEVLISGVEERFFPLGGRDSVVVGFENKESVEEERRLLYVAMTRAKKVLSLSYCSSYKDLRGWSYRNQPSLFLEDIPKEMLKKVTVKRTFEHRALARKGFFYSSACANLAYRPSQKVLHRLWGKGTVLKVWDAGGDLYVRVLFKEEGEKVIVPEYDHLEILVADKGGGENE